MQILGLDFTEGGATNYQTFMTRQRPAFPVGLSTRDAANNYLQLSVMTPGYVPKLVFIDSTGTIRGQYDGADAFLQNNSETNIRAKLDELVATAKKPAAAAKGPVKTAPKAATK
ncbi:MAG: hypothetical protein U0Q16_14030 [Bryobacteraceae bacterium]